MTRNEWIAYHDEHARRHGESEMYVEKPCREIFSEEHGIFQYEIYNNGEMVVLEIIGHLFYWNDLIPWVAKTFGCEKIVCYYNTDNPKRLERLYRMKATPLDNGTYRFERVVT